MIQKHEILHANTLAPALKAVWDMQNAESNDRLWGMQQVFRVCGITDDEEHIIAFAAKFGVTDTEIAAYAARYGYTIDEVNELQTL